jgi:hypothetical protein
MRPRISAVERGSDDRVKLGRRAATSLLCWEKRMWLTEATCEERDREATNEARM